MRMRDGNGQSMAIHRADYSAPAFWIDTVELCFDLDPAKTRVLNKMRLRRNPDVPAQALKLNGEELNLARVLVNDSGSGVMRHADAGYELAVATAKKQGLKLPMIR